jgi:hypothetical protein
MFTSEQIAALLTGEGDAMEDLRQQARDNLSALAESLAQEFSDNLSAKVQTRLNAVQADLEESSDAGFGGGSTSQSGFSLDNWFSGALSSVVNTVGSSLIRGKKPSTKTVVNALGRSLGNDWLQSSGITQRKTQLRLSGAQQGQALVSAMAKAQKNQ